MKNDSCNNYSNTEIVKSRFYLDNFIGEEKKASD